MNNTIIIGNVVRDAELKNVNVNGTPTARCRFSVAVNETRSNGEAIVTYFEVSLWRDRASRLAQYLKRGRQVAVTGHVRLNQYTDANHIVRSSLQLHSAEVTLLGKKPQEEAPAPAEEMETVSAAEVEDDDEFPFG